MDNSSSFVPLLKPHERGSKASKERNRLRFAPLSKERIDCRSPRFDVRTFRRPDPFFSTPNLEFFRADDFLRPLRGVEIEPVEEGRVIVFPSELVVAQGHFEIGVIEINCCPHVT